MVNYFFDSYAVIELISGNPGYAKYSQEPVIITIFNLAEIYWFSLNEYGDKKADEIFENYQACVIDVNNDILREAIKFRRKNKKKKLSYADCISYIYAKNNGLIFLTGDKEFKDLKNVEFVK